LRRGRKLVDWAPIVEALADKLSLERFRILAISGGAPYAFATAWALGERVRAVAIVSGAPPIAELTDHTGLWRLHRWMLAVHARSPGLSRTLFRMAKPFAATRPPVRIRPLLLKLLQPCDADVLRDTAAFEACFESSRRAWRASTTGVLADAEIYAQPWGFPLEEVRTPVHLWHGTKDRTFSPRLAEGMAARLPDCRLHIVEGGHYSLPVRNMHRILAELIER
jgi:pimeloyl-ACP methyl ester carboxylesterase